MEAALRRQFQTLRDSLDERGRREFAATEAEKIGRGGVTLVHRATGLARSTIQRGMKELAAKEASGDAPAPTRRRIRRAGGGRQPREVEPPTLSADLQSLVDGYTRGDPMTALLWTTKSLRRLAGELREMGHVVSHTKVGELLRSAGYTLQANKKVNEGTSHPDRDAQFGYVNAQVKRQLATGNPAVSVDTKKKELVGPFKNTGREWARTGQSERVNVHDFIDPMLGRAIP